jgi:hypothetical protein
MLDWLRILLCGVGAVYLVIRLAGFLRALAGGRCLWPPLYESDPEVRRIETRLAAQRQGKVASLRERATVSSTRFSD